MNVKDIIENYLRDNASIEQWRNKKLKVTIEEVEEGVQ